MPRPKAAKAPAASAEEQAPPAADAPASQAQEGGPSAKKKRNNNPGVRVQGGRVYDSENGTTCHQCRQKTIETKAKCTKCTLYFCPKCLENRYHEKVEDANATADWACPRCRGECNCSNCRKKAGKEATGQLANIAKKAGFGSVRDLLEKNPHAKALQLPKLPPGAGAAGGGSCRAGAAGSGTASREGSAALGNEGAEEAAAGAQRKRPAQKRKAAAEEAEKELVPDEELPPRAVEMPEARRPAVHKAAHAAAAGGKRMRGGLAWSADVPNAVELPEGEVGAELAAVLEFLQVFGGKIGLRSPPLAPLVAELLQPATDDERLLLCSAPADSLAGLVHCRLLEVVRAFWNVKGDVRSGAWQGVMRGYYAASLLSQRQALDLRWQHGPPAVAGELFSRPVVALGAEEHAEGAGEAPGPEGMEVDGEGEALLGTGGAAAVTTVDYPAGGYWGLQPAVRVAMLHALVHDALETDELRKAIEDSMGDAMDEEKERRQQLAGVRKEARAAIQRERDQQVALMIANAATGGLTLEQQQAMLEEARQRAEAAAASAAAAKLKALGEKVHPPSVRAAVVGTDRDGRRYLQLQAAQLLTGDGGIVVQCCGPEGPSALCSAGTGGADSDGEGEAERREAYGCYAADDLVAVAAALHPQGLREGPLRAALLHAFKLPKEAVAAASGSQGEEQLTQAVAQQTQGEAAAEAKPTIEAEAAEDAEQQQQGEAQPAAGTAVSGDGAPAPAGKQGGRGRKRAAAAAATAVEPAGQAAAQTAPAKRAAKQARSQGGKGKGKAGSPAAEVAMPEIEPEAAGGKRQRSASQGTDGEVARPGGKRYKAAAGAAAGEEPAAATGGRRSARRGSPPAAAAVGKAVGRRTRKAVQAENAQLPLKVDDMLSP